MSYCVQYSSCGQLTIGKGVHDMINYIFYFHNFLAYIRVSNLSVARSSWSNHVICDGFSLDGNVVILVSYDVRVHSIGRSTGGNIGCRFYE